MRIYKYSTPGLDNDRNQGTLREGKSASEKKSWEKKVEVERPKWNSTKQLSHVQLPNRRSHIVAHRLRRGLARSYLT